MTAQELQRLDKLAFADIRREIERARIKFPGNEHMYAALVEEIGETANALIDHEFGKLTTLSVWNEAVQVACVAVRCAAEGDTDFRLAHDPRSSVYARTERVLSQAEQRLPELRAVFPDSARQLRRLNVHVGRFGDLMERIALNCGSVDALEGLAAHIVAHAVRLAVEGDACFPYACPFALVPAGERAQ